MSYEMGIEMNYANPYDHVPEAERNNRVITYRFWIVYYRFPYKKVPRIMICHFAMNATQNVYLFPSKVVVSAH